MSSYRLPTNTQNFIMENLPENIKQLIVNQRNIDFFPQFGSVNLKDENTYSISFEVPYKTPPIVIAMPQRRDAPAKKEQGFGIEPIEIKIKPPSVAKITGVNVAIPAIKLDAISLPQIELPELSDITIESITALSKEIAISIKESVVEFKEIVKSTLKFPKLPILSPWTVDWAKMNTNRTFGENLISSGSVSAIAIPAANSGESSISSLAPQDISTALAAITVGTIGDGSTSELTNVDLVAALNEVEYTPPSGGGGGGGFTVIGPTDTYEKLGEVGNKLESTLEELNEPRLASEEISPPSSKPLTDQLSKELEEKRTPLPGKFTAKTKALGKLDMTLTVIEESESLKTNVDISSIINRQAGQFTGAFNFNFGADVFGGIKNQIGFRARSILIVEEDIDVLFIVGGSQGYRLWLNGSTIIDQWFDKSFIDTTPIQKKLLKGTYTLTFDWYNWNGTVPAAFFSTVPPFMPQVGKVEFDLENAMEMAFVGAWFFIRDMINEVYDSFLPIWTIALPDVDFPRMHFWSKRSFTITVPKIKALKKTIYKGKSWTITIPALDIPRTSLVKESKLVLDIAAPFKAANSALFNVLSIFPRWFGRYAGRTTGRHISASIEAVMDVAKGAYNFVKDMGGSIVDFFQSQIDEQEKKFEESISGLKDSVNKNLALFKDNVKEVSEKAINESIKLATDNLNSMSGILAKKFSTALGVRSEEMMTSIQEQVNKSFGVMVTDINSKLNTIAGTISEATALGVNNALNDTIKKINTKVDALNIAQNKEIETKLNSSMEDITKKINFVLQAIIPEVYEALGLKPGTAISQANLVGNASVKGFHLEGLKGGVRINWIAVGTPDLSQVSSEAIDLIDV